MQTRMLLRTLRQQRRVGCSGSSSTSSLGILCAGTRHASCSQPAVFVPNERTLPALRKLAHPLNHQKSSRELLSVARCFSTTTSTTTNASAVIEDSSSNVQSRGLFSIPELQTPSDFIRQAHTAIEECESIRRELVALAGSSTTTADSSSSSSSYLLFQLDAVSRIVCNVIDAAELARSVHACPHWRENAHRAFVVLADYITQLNADPVLYQTLLHVTPTTEEETRFAALLRAEFERDGIHLPDHQREQVRRLQNQITELESIFTRNIVASQKEFWVEAAAVENVIPPHVLQQFGLGRKKLSENSASPQEMIQLCQNSQQVLQTLIKYSASPALRKQVYMESTTAVPENLAVLQALIATRHELATTLGFESYADRFLQDKMAQTPATVREFLSRVQERIQPQFRYEMDLLTRAKQHVEGSCGSNDGVVLEPWDVSFYSALLQSRNGFDIHSVSQYLSLSSTIQTLQTLVYDLFGIEMKEEALTPVEEWDVADTNSSAGRRAQRLSKTTSQLRRFVFTDSLTSSPLGIMYLDLHGRDGKYHHAAHFTVRCGCRTRYTPEKMITTTTTLDTDHDFQLPVVALVCNFSSHAPDEAMSHAEMETLFHEFGHGLHSLLSRTVFQHMSGTRGAMDFVETPSHLMENFVWDEYTLTQSNDAIPKSLIQQLRASRWQFAAIDKQTQILYSLLDQTLFGQMDEALRHQITTDPHATTRIFADLHHQLQLPYAPGTHWHSRFGHLITYGAGYYGYLWAQVFAHDVWNHLFETPSAAATSSSDGDDVAALIKAPRRKSGDRLWHEMLQHGGAKDPTAMLTNLLGRPPIVDSFATTKTRK